MPKRVILACLTMFVSIRCDAAGLLTGRVVEDRSGAPVQSSDVRIYRDGVRMLAADLETDGNDRFEGAGLPQGD